MSTSATVSIARLCLPHLPVCASSVSTRRRPVATASTSRAIVSCGHGQVAQRIDGRTIDVDDDHLQAGWCGPTQPLVAGGMDHSVAGEPTEPCGSF
jgi:hypothetical protein